MATTFNPESPERTYRALHLFAGIGGGSLGFKKSRFDWRGVPGQFENILAIDSDPGACESYRKITGDRAECWDLFSREQYVRFHGSEPPEDWQEITGADIFEACNGVAPDVVFTSPPCKGLSGLLPQASAKLDRYQALNQLTVRGIELTIDAFPDPPRVFLLENVPRITSRGKELLAQIISLLESRGYVVDQRTHDCGELGGLGQRRKRFLLIARHQESMKPFIYQPPQCALKSIGDIIGSLPLPDDSEMGPMHRLPRLKWLTWLRLALIPAGGDWRDLQKIDPDQYGVENLPRSGYQQVAPWDKPTGTVTAASRVSRSNGVAAVADPRLQHTPRGGGPWGVQKFDETGNTVTGSASVKGSTAASVADPRLKHTPRGGVYRVLDMDETSGAITGGQGVGVSNGPQAIADPRMPENLNRHHANFRVGDFDQPAGTVTGATHVANGAACIADPRLKKDAEEYSGSPGLYGVTAFDDPQPTVTATAKVSSSNAPAAIADPRLPESKGVYSNRFRVVKFDDTAPTVTGDTDVQCGAPSIADPRLKDNNNRHNNKFRISSFKNPAPCITGTRFGSGAIAIEDPRLNCSPYAGSYGVQDWEETSPTVSGSMDLHAGSAAVSDPRIPEPGERLDPPPVIIALDGTWHRPLTTLELAALQSFPMTLADGSPFVLAGKSDGKWREWIGNAVPPLAAKAIAEVIGEALLQADLGETFVLGMTGLWVRPDERVDSVVVRN